MQEIIDALLTFAQAGATPAPESCDNIEEVVRDVIGDMETAFGRLREEFGAGEAPRTLNFITGPSRSADIEQTLLLGAHRPRKLHVIVVGNP